VKKLWSLLKPLLTGCDQYYRGKRLCGVTLEVTVEEGYPTIITVKHRHCKNLVQLQKGSIQLSSENYPDDIHFDNSVKSNIIYKCSQKD